MHFYKIEDILFYLYSCVLNRKEKAKPECACSGSAFFIAGIFFLL
ncbi:hypothetical protein HMPREF0083_01915 [Aneurinibacillus aneurinilyticus ATCC 12856]|uniref:Uncharacterized protein n=1 Tax=Aneurinibacillus aneurinilyticus ATCC 12856 TaxID=649747 RepID=U1YGR1_ANEAE|nr:hypothetical protein HMPREF0083_01915 [Aneurinibacillus aneurinilyticus ATCC 12856]